ncbi:TPA: prepilin-type N-terminal cleavage/methylation domain-containing protein [Vibrio vulnificus]|jgi:prepilin-type N-terminal cleavage/methylation domain-containing protein|uniref:prepilin-type N-terminal cleavage/methylation domain-containing protein n=1 Tax=Vibrio TaxID=662 RepID=UPI0009266341|nr:MULTISPECIES: prepilin-type N-terminal cleavage/methylation domain-containing protein [Vibrio]OJI57949.1 hypothetical protein VFL11327_02352 [Vibrio fluvialis]MCG9654277.1 prepilin-type N-terminal cleavage/methylation domain-containing protein [Vibrio vulnificus]OJI53476.1 hypothetical protein VV1062A_03001 [Vibrio vulnificus]POB26670.1 prepilin-type N-terminal cleavage/methylation domain-containing protein [Vibrio vulnificus]USD50203.1 prepilin-type N-terminal cleavage/methylation domain-c
MPTKVLTAKIKSTRGFTMIELLVVLALLGAVSTIVVPQLWGQYTRFAQQQQVEKFWGKVRDRAVLLRKHGENFVFEQQNPKWQKLAAEYDLTLQKSDVIIVRADGFTAGGTINLQVESKEAYWKIEIATPDGTVNIARR